MKKIVYLLILFAFACKPELNKTSHNTTLSKPKTNSIHIIGVSDNKKVNESISFYNDSLFYYGRRNKIERVISGDSVKINVQDITKTTLLEVNAFGGDFLYINRIIATPGDTIYYTFKEGKLTFQGRNKEHYNFYSQMDPNYDAWSKLYLNKYNPDFVKYKQQCDSLYNKRFNFYKDYIAKYPNVSSDFKTIIETDLRFEYLVNLVKPRSETQSKWNVNTQEDLFTIYERGDKKEGDFFDIDGYLGDITIEELNKPEYENYLYYQMSIIPLIQQYFIRSSTIPFSMDAFKEELKFLQQNFHQTIANRVTGKLILKYFQRGFGKDENTYEFFKETIANYKKTVTDSNIIQAMEDVENELSSINKLVPKDLTEMVLNLSRDTVDFKSVLHKKSIKVIDFWASWCGPCIEEIITSNKKRERLKEKYNIDFIYISTDKDIEKWIAKSLDLYEYLPGYPQYKLLNLKKSKLIKYLNLKSSIGMTIPRYVILDENNVIIDNNAPKPSDERFEEVLLK